MADDCVGVVVAVCAAATIVVASLCPALIKAAPARACAVIDRYSWLCRDTSVTLVDYPAGRRSLHVSAPGSRPCHWTAESRPPVQRGLPVCAHEDGPLSTVASSVSRSRTGCRELEPRSLVSPRRPCTTCRSLGTCLLPALFSCRGTWCCSPAPFLPCRLSQPFVPAVAPLPPNRRRCAWFPPACLSRRRLPRRPSLMTHAACVACASWPMVLSLSSSPWSWPALLHVVLSCVITEPVGKPECPGPPRGEGPQA